MLVNTLNPPPVEELRPPVVTVDGVVVDLGDGAQTLDNVRRALTSVVNRPTRGDALQFILARLGLGLR